MIFNSTKRMTCPELHHEIRYAKTLVGRKQEIGMAFRLLQTTLIYTSSGVLRTRDAHNNIVIVLVLLASTNIFIAISVTCNILERGEIGISLEEK
jgi:hypothetical protein